MAMQKIFAREILDSRGNPTVEVDLHTAKGNTGLLKWFAQKTLSLTGSFPKSSMPHPLLRQRFLPPDFFADSLLFLAPKLGEAGVSVFAPIPGSREVTPDLCGWTPSDPPVPPAQVDSERLCQAELPQVSMKHWSYEMETNHDTWGKEC